MCNRIVFSIFVILVIFVSFHAISGKIETETSGPFKYYSIETKGMSRDDINQTLYKYINNDLVKISNLKSMLEYTGRTDFTCTIGISTIGITREADPKNEYFGICIYNHGYFGRLYYSRINFKTDRDLNLTSKSIRTLHSIFDVQ